MKVNAIFAGLVVLGIAAGTAADQTVSRQSTFVGGYYVFAADFHLHSSLGSDGLLSPFGLLLEARRQGLGVIAVTGHNETATSRFAQWISRKLGTVTVLTGEEIVAPKYHLIALGITKAVSFRQTPADAIDAIHRQGGVAIAAHPTHEYSSAFNDAAISKLDGSEVCHPTVYKRVQAQYELEEFAQRGTMAAIGSSDYHGVGRMGSCRTLVFARDGTAQAILEAIRAHRTVVFGPRGRVYGPPELVKVAEAAGQEQHPSSAGKVWMDWLSRIAGIIGLAGMIFG